MRKIITIAASALIYIAIQTIRLGGFELLLGALIAGVLSSIWFKGYIKSIFSGLISVVIGILILLIYYLFINPYGTLVLFSTGIIFFMPIIFSIIMGIFGASLIEAVRRTFYT